MEARIERQEDGSLTLTIEGMADDHLTRTYYALNDYNLAAPGRHSTVEVAESLLRAMRSQHDW